MTNSSTNRSRKGAERIRKILLGFFALLTSAFLLFFTGAAPATYALAATLTAYDETSIDDDLEASGVIGSAAYPKNASDKHRLIDGAGFMEYAYSNDAEIANAYYGIYLYVYNPTEKDVSTRSGSNMVNMAISYDSDGEPTEYANVEITLLDKTDSNRFLKFKITNAQALYRREKEYAAAHEGKRRYDIASIQLWFVGDNNATDSFTQTDNANGEGVSFTYYCTGYAAGCSASGSDESSLQITAKKLETVELDVRDTYYRTGAHTAGEDGQYTLSSVYFSVPTRYVTEYGQLQIIKAEWYEYKTTPIFVTDSEEVKSMLDAYSGYVLPKIVTTVYGEEIYYYYSDSVPFSVYRYLGPNDSGIQGIGYNYKKASPSLQRYDWVIYTDNILNEVDNDVLADYARNYTGNSGDELLTYGGKSLNANLFQDTVDDGRTMGYNERVFDARNEDDWIDLTLENTSSWWTRLWANLAKIGEESFVIQEGILPIEEVTEDKISSSDAVASENLYVAQSQVSDLKEYYEEKSAEDETVYLFRFAVTEYESWEMEYHDEHDDWLGNPCAEFYAATATTFLDFDIIYLGFVRGEEETIIPVVHSPIDIYPVMTPPPSMTEAAWWALLWILVAITGGSLVVLALSTWVKIKVRRK